ncbi:MAG: glycosyltransferase family 4 protein, partial [Planctomycetes bacterium]|nr:glycosyltransferase family 4 protein [Planctomycetota bacterium]
HGLERYVTLAGARPHGELPLWYSAADLFILLSSREGSPNVVLESLACGTPVVATGVGSIPDDPADPGFGLVLRERSAPAAASGVRKALASRWDRGRIRRAIESRSWCRTARRIASLVETTIEEHANGG